MRAGGLAINDRSAGKYEPTNVVVQQASADDDVEGTRNHVDVALLSEHLSFCLQVA